MLYWYRDLMVDEKLKKHFNDHRVRIERYYRALPKSKFFSEKERWWERIVGKKIPWRDYTVIVRAENPDNLFEVMSTRQWIFRHYEKMDIYVLGLFASSSNAVSCLEELLNEGYKNDTSYDPREAFADPEDYETLTNEEVGI